MQNLQGLFLFCENTACKPSSTEEFSDKISKHIHLLSTFLDHHPKMILLRTDSALLSWYDCMKLWHDTSCVTLLRHYID
jgi:hypothetical protein